MTQPAPNPTPIHDLYARLLDAWNRRSAADFAALFTEQANVIGFDGSMMSGRAEIESTLSGIFADHPTGRYVGIVREVRFLNDDSALLRSVAGIVPANQADLNPDLNSVQSLVAVHSGNVWRIELYSNTPAAFHGREADRQALTDELRALV